MQTATPPINSNPIASAASAVRPANIVRHSPGRPLAPRPSGMWLESVSIREIRVSELGTWNLELGTVASGRDVADVEILGRARLRHPHEPDPRHGARNRLRAVHGRR